MKRTSTAATGEIGHFTDYALGDEQQSCNPPALALDVLKRLWGNTDMKRLLITICGRAGSKGF